MPMPYRRNRQSGLWAELCAAVSAELVATTTLLARVGHDLALQLAAWHTDNTGDAAAAEQALAAAAAYEPTSTTALTRLVDARREVVGAKLVGALARLAEASREDGDVVTELGARREAAEIVRPSDPAGAATLLTALADRVADVWAEGGDVVDLGTWLTEERAAIALETGAPARGRRRAGVGRRAAVPGRGASCVPASRRSLDGLTSLRNRVP